MPQSCVNFDDSDIIGTDSMLSPTLHLPNVVLGKIELSTIAANNHSEPMMMC